MTPQERDYFAAWLEREAHTSTKLIEQMEKLGPAFMPAMAREKSEALACLLIARKLRATESEDIG